jgi:hypothetical protein
MGISGARAALLQSQCAVLFGDMTCTRQIIPVLSSLN